MKKTLVLFDFDGTITTKDTFLLFIVFSKGKLGAGLVFFLYIPMILLFMCRLISAETLKSKLMKFCFKGKSEEELKETGKRFIDGLYKNKIIKEEFIKKIHDYKINGSEVCVVSASIDVWLSAFCGKEEIQLLCTELKYEQGIFKGEFKTPNCNNEEKARRIKNAFFLENYGRIIAYGNSKADKAMYSLATEVHKV